ncbi:hypothetical protein D030_1614A, partial [Vibrio parahaemolyticus AQ3810]
MRSISSDHSIRPGRTTSPITATARLGATFNHDFSLKSVFSGTN